MYGTNVWDNVIAERFHTRQNKIDAWLHALRSGRYQQVTGQLRKGDGFCCLGVFCDLNQDKDNKWIRDNDFEYMRPSGHLSSEGAVLPNIFVDMLHEMHLNAVYEYPDVKRISMDDFHECLVSLNDRYFNFNQIADVIELVFYGTPLDHYLSVELLAKLSFKDYTTLKQAGLYCRLVGTG